MAQQNYGNTGTRPGGRARAAVGGSGGMQASGSTAAAGARHPGRSGAPCDSPRRRFRRYCGPAVCAERKRS
jgi:hypothetical protein